MVGVLSGLTGVETTGVAGVTGYWISAAGWRSANGLSTLDADRGGRPGGDFQRPALRPGHPANR